LLVQTLLMGMVYLLVSNQHFTKHTNTLEMRHHHVHVMPNSLSALFDQLFFHDPIFHLFRMKRI